MIGRFFGLRLLMGAMRSASITAVVLLLSGRALAAEACPPIAVVDAPDATAREIAPLLVDRGVEVEPAGLPPGGCGVLHVHVDVSEGAFRITIRDPWGRTAERTVKSLATAATLIESWARMDLLEAAATSTQAVTPAPRTPVSPADEPRESNTLAAAPLPEAGYSWRLSAELGVARNRGRWLGGALSLCGELGFACVGATARYSLSQRHQSDVDVMFDLNVPLELGRLTVTPGIGLGGGWLGSLGEGRLCFAGGRSLRSSACGEGAEHPGFGGRAEARLFASLRLFDSLHLQVGASWTVVLPDRELMTIRGQAGLLWGWP